MEKFELNDGCNALNRMNDEELSDYWDKDRSSELLDEGEQIEVEVSEVKAQCPACKTSRTRRRVIDLPVSESLLVFKCVGTLYCVDCRSSIIEEAAFGELLNRLSSLGLDAKQGDLRKNLEKSLQEYDKRLVDTESNRKVVSIYFPNKEHGSKKAQMSLKSSDPLYTKVRSLGSDAIRGLLKVNYYEDLEEKAKKSNRTVSKFMQMHLAKLLLDFQDADKQFERKTITYELIPRKVQQSYFEQSQDSSLTLAADTETADILILETIDRKLSGILIFDYATAILSLDIKRNDLNADVFNVSIVLNDGQEIPSSEAELKDNRLILLKDTVDVSPLIEKVLLGAGKSNYEQR